VGGTLLVVLIVMTAIIVGNSQTCEQVFRLLRWLANRPEPPHTEQPNGLNACEGGSEGRPTSRRTSTAIKS
jgi:hypothetical protein